MFYSLFAQDYYSVVFKTNKESVTVITPFEITALKPLLSLCSNFPERWMVVIFMLSSHVKNVYVNISHIPVILLTAKSSDKAQIEALEAGADAFIAKPFNMDILQLKIQKLIEQQEERRDFFKKNITVNFSKITSTHVDEELIKKVLQKIEMNLDNVSYSVEKLSKDMNMDRTGLYRKLSALTGQTPSELIRSVRLKYATQLLQKGLPVSEVAENVGFSSTSYFTKCFHEEFGLKPSQYNKSEQK